MSEFARRLICAVAFVLVLGVPLRAQESLDSGKTPAQLFASDCAVCHKSPKGLARPAMMSGLEEFLRQHYTASRQSAAAIAGYLRAAGAAPAPPRAAKRTPKGEDKAKGEKKPDAAKADEGKPGESKPGEGKSGEGKADAQPAAAEPKAAEPKAAEPKPVEPKPAEAKPAEGGKSD